MADQPDDSFFTLWGGLKVHASEFVPQGADFGLETKPGRIQWFGLDPAAPDGDTTVYQINPTFRIDKGLLDDLSEADLKISQKVSLEMEARRQAAMLYALQTGTTQQPNESRPFRMEDMLAILRDMERRQRDHKIKLVEALIASGLTVTCNDATDRPVAVLPADYADALAEVTRERDNRDPAENFYRGWGYWPERFTPEQIDGYKADNIAEWRNQYLGEFGPSDEPGDAK